MYELQDCDPPATIIIVADGLQCTALWVLHDRCFRLFFLSLTLVILEQFYPSTEPEDPFLYDLHSAVLLLNRYSTGILIWRCGFLFQGRHFHLHFIYSFYKRPVLCYYFC